MVTMSKAFAVRSMGLPNVEDYRTIRLSALKTAPEAFGSVHAIEASKPIEEHAERLTSSLVFGAYDDDQIVGMVGLKAEKGPKDAHKGFMRGGYIEPEYKEMPYWISLSFRSLESCTRRSRASDAVGGSGECSRHRLV